MLAVPTDADLAVFTGRPVASFGAYGSEALKQAALMFSILTKLPDYPADPDMAQLAKNAIMEMADRLLLEQPYQAIKAGPFQSETIGSYSYSRVTQTAKLATTGAKTGLFWWDLAIAELMVGDANVTASGGIHHMPDGLAVDQAGEVHLLNVSEQDDTDWPPYVRIS